MKLFNLPSKTSLKELVFDISSVRCSMNGKRKAVAAECPSLSRVIYLREIRLESNPPNQ